MSQTYEEGDRCPIEDCKGVLQFLPVENCTCFISPPCSACIENPLTCSECGWQVENKE
jgi:hypothetical protein